jgi:Domain of unknown function (DUF4124)
MVRRHALALALGTLLALAAAAPAVQAATFKWVDEKGVTNYSNSPPPSAKAAKPVQTVEDRLSTYETDPSLKAAAQSNRPSSGSAEAEWLQRQQIMAMRAGYMDCPSPYRSDCAPDGYRSAAYAPMYPMRFPVFNRTRFSPTSFPASASRAHTRRSSASHLLR